MVALRITHSGDVIESATWEGVEMRLAETVLDPDDLLSGFAFRQHVHTVARKFSGVDLDLTGSALDFLHECERAGLVIVIFGQPQASYTVVEPDARRVYRERLEARKKGSADADHVTA